MLREVGGAPRRKRARAATPEGAPVPVTVATVIDAAPVADGEAWLASAGDEIIAVAFDVLAYAVHAYRVAAADPLAAEASGDAALIVRVGYGSGEEVADGRWTAAREVPVARRAGLRERRRDALRPQERLAALLGGRDAVLACEELALRARLDLDRGRTREAALQTHLALEAARVELAAWSGLTGMADRISELDARRDDVAGAANSALQGGLDAAALDVVEEAVEQVEAALRARGVAGAY